MLLLSACGSGEQKGSSGVDEAKRGAVNIAHALIENGELTLIVDSCNGSPKAKVKEMADRIEISVVSDIRTTGNACQDSVPLPLEAERGSRKLIDQSNGQEIELLGSE